MESWSPYATEFYDPLMAGSIDGTDEIPHDHGIVRAMNAVYKPNKSVSSCANKTIFISRLDWDTTENTLRSVFSRYGPISFLRLIRDLVTGFSKGYAFIEYEEEQHAIKAFRDANRMVIDGRTIFVDFECERNLTGWIPRRLGGGFGGKKESGQLRFGGRDRPFRKPLIVPLKVHVDRLDINPYLQSDSKKYSVDLTDKNVESEHMADKLENGIHRRDFVHQTDRKSSHNDWTDHSNSLRSNSPHDSKSSKHYRSSNSSRTHKKTSHRRSRSRSPDNRRHDKKTDRHRYKSPASPNSKRSYYSSNKSPTYERNVH